MVKTGWHKKLLNDLRIWARSRPEIRLMLLQGSLATGGYTDTWSDLDLACFTDDFSLLTDPSFPAEIAPVETWVADRFSFRDREIQTRLVIYQGGRKVDFSFWPLAVLEALKPPGPLPDAFKTAYQVIFDPDRMAGGLLPPEDAGFTVLQPGPGEKEKCLREFSFECWHVRKYLSRGEMYHALWRLGEARKWLLQLMVWEVAARQDWQLKVRPMEKNLNQWLPEALIHALHGTFALPEESSIGKSLAKLEKLFSQHSAD